MCTRLSLATDGAMAATGLFSPCAITLLRRTGHSEESWVITAPLTLGGLTAGAWWICPCH